MTEKHIRSLVKTVSWRLIASLTTMLLIFIFTRDHILSIGIGFLEMATKLIAYYVHERMWNKIGWGTSSNPEI